MNPENPAIFWQKDQETMDGVTLIEPKIFYVTWIPITHNIMKLIILQIGVIIT